MQLPVGTVLSNKQFHGQDSFDTRFAVIVGEAQKLYYKCAHLPKIKNEAKMIMSGRSISIPVYPPSQPLQQAGKELFHVHINSLTDMWQDVWSVVSKEDEFEDLEVNEVMMKG